MRALLVALTLLLAGCSGTSQDAPATETEPSTSDPGPDAGAPPEASEPLVEIDPHLGNTTCPLEDRPVYTTGGVRTPYFGTSSTCELGDLEIPDETRSVRLVFTYTVTQADDDFGIRLYHPDLCTQTSSGDECSIAEAFGPSPVVLDVDAGTLGDYVLSELDAYAVGYGVDTTLDLELAFYASDAPA